MNGTTKSIKNLKVLPTDSQIIKALTSGSYVLNIGNF